MPLSVSRLVRVRHALAVCTALAACNSRSDSSGGGRRSAPDADTTLRRAATVPADTGCLKQGLWALCSVEDRMVHAGLVIDRRTSPASVDLFSVSGTSYGVGAGVDEVQIFLYPTAAAREADTSKLDSLAVSPKGTRRSYQVMPLLVTSNNLAALVFTRNDRSQERVALALSAGLPQPKP